MPKVRPKPDRIETEFGNRLQELRIKYGYTLQVLADKANLNVSSLTAYENRGAYPSMERFIDLARALNVSMDQLAGFKKPDPMPIEHVFIRRINRDQEVQVCQVLINQGRMSVWVTGA